jgi:anti-sigma factor RsiW
MNELCADMQIRLNAYLDNELSASDVLAIEAHLKTCAACQAKWSAMVSLKAKLNTALDDDGAPPHLAAKIRHALRQARQNPLDRLMARIVFSLRTSWGAMSVAATVTAMVIISAGVGFRPPDFTRDIVNSHVRSLNEARLVDISAADQEVLRPWFVRNVGYVPPVFSGTEVGCRLMGGRVDYIDQKKTATVVYQCGDHTVNLYVAPSQKGKMAPRLKVVGNYRLATWRGQKLACQAVSDLGEKDMLRFAHYIQARATVS